MSGGRRLSVGFALCIGLAAGALLASLKEAGAKDDAEAPPPARALFSPGGGIEPALLEVVKDAKREVFVAMYDFTSKPLAEALVGAKQRGVDVRVVLDRTETERIKKYARYADLRHGKIPVRLMTLGKNANDQDIRFHHKFMVVDREVVATGSFNWTSQADAENYENEVVIASKKLAADFRAEFERCWQKADDDSKKVEKD
jgi:phosphatidylserine/phosphatidylglycerophosphate/cardiolipin synthase-like enzyme